MISFSTAGLFFAVIRKTVGRNLAKQYRYMLSGSEEIREPAETFSEMSVKCVGCNVIENPGPDRTIAPKDSKIPVVPLYIVLGWIPDLG